MTDELSVSGFCAPAFDEVREVFTTSLRNGRERLGAAVAVTGRGEPLVDLWGGHADLARTRPWRRDTMVCIYSVTKGITALCALRLVDEGLLDLDAPVAAYWPEFARSGKAAIPVRWLLSHRAGLPALQRPLPLEAMYDWDTMADALAAQAPEWPPGTRHGYHALTFGWLVGEVIRRVAGRSVGAYLRAEMAGPLDLDIHIGVPPSEHKRVAETSPLPPPSEPGPGGDELARLFLVDPHGMAARAFLNLPNLPRADRARWLTAEIPAANGCATARALARLFGLLAAGPARGCGLLGPAALERCRSIESSGVDAILCIPTRFSHGFMRSWAPVQGAGTFGHVGAGGSVAFADPETGIGFGYVTSHLGGRLLLDPRPRALIDALYSALRRVRAGAKVS